MAWASASITGVPNRNELGISATRSVCFLHKSISWYKHFKQKLWELPEQEKQPILKRLEQQLRLLFEKLNVFNPREGVESYV